MRPAGVLLLAQNSINEDWVAPIIGYTRTIGCVVSVGAALYEPGGRRGVHPFDWAVRFEKQARELMLKGDDAPLIAYETLGGDAMLSAPTPDHYLPLLYVLGLRKKDERVSFPVEGVDGGSVSMLAVQLG